jgi:broad specificity phosphatase PhoE
MKLHLVRHGQSIGNVNPETYYTTADEDIELTAEGIAQSRWAGTHLIKACEQDDEIHLWNSPYIRAAQTADEIDSQFILGGRYPKRAEHIMLYERSWGALRDLVKSGSYTPTDFRFFSRPHRGESYADVAVRVKVFLADVAALKLKDTASLICVTHGDWMRVAHMILTGQTTAEFDQRQDLPANAETRSYIIF